MPSLVVVTCRDRYEKGRALAENLGAHLVCDWDMYGAISGHVMALEWAAQQEDRVVVLEDDAQPVAGFHGLSTEVLGAYPNDLVSLYLGTGYPDGYQPHIQVEVESGASIVELRNLIHGVCYSIPNGMEASVISKMDKTLPADFSIGRAWVSLTDRPVIYPLPSLVDHEDSQRVEQTGSRLLPRKAWRLYQ